MPYGTLSTDIIESSGNLAVTGTVVPTGGVFSSNAPGINRIVNGSMVIDQRNAGAAQTITAGAALAYTVDRWYAYCTGANVTGQRVAGPGGNLFAYRFTGAANVTAIGFGQRIEAVNCSDLAGSTASLSVELANTQLTTVTWTAFYANTTDTFGTLASPTRTQFATGTFTVNSTQTRYTTTMSVPSAAITGIEIVFTVGAQTSGTWTIDMVQLEAGNLATPFERRSIAQEIQFCQRYYEKSYNLDVVPGTVTDVGRNILNSNNAGYWAATIYFATQKRATPTVTLYSTVSGAAGNIRSISGGSSDVAATATAGTSSAQLTGGPNNANGWFVCHWVAAIEL